MGLRINTNVPSITAQRNLKLTKRSLDSNYARLASGSRISKAADDAAGLAISEKLKAQIRSIRQARRNAEDGISLVQTAEGAISEISAMLIRMRELAIQAASDTVGDEERKFTDLEFQALKDEIERISQSSMYNSTKLLNGTGGVIEIQIGTKNNPFEDRFRFDASLIDTTVNTLGILETGVGMKENAQNTLTTLDTAITTVNGSRAELGALQNRLISVTNTLDINDENFSAANSRIRDVDVASESADLAKNNILTQSGVSVLAQANQAPNLALKLLS